MSFILFSLVLHHICSFYVNIHDLYYFSLKTYEMQTHIQHIQQIYASNINLNH